MNSEQLEQSLRTEFEQYLKAVIAEMRQETAEFQSKIEAEFESHKSRIDEAVKSFAGRFESEHQFDPGFMGSVSEHLRLARDEGAKIAAEAMAEAERLAEPVPAPAPEPPSPSLDGLRDAIAAISSKDSQSTILKELVQHAAEYAPRGAFFIVKNEHFVGWKVFGVDDDSVESAVRDISFPTSADSLLGVSVRSLASTESTAGTNSDDSTFLDPLNFGQPDRMYAIPLTARGRGVAVLYADQGTDGSPVNREALEMLVRVAGLTVELLASSQTARAEAPASDLEAATETSPVVAEYASPVAAEPAPVETGTSDFAFSESVSYEGGFDREPTPEPAHEAEPVPTEAFDYQPFQPESEVQTVSEPEPEPVRDYEHEYQPEAEVEQEPHQEPAHFDSPVEPTPFATTSPFDTSASPEYAPAGVSTGGFERAVEPIIEPSVPAVPQARLSDRNVDLPIEVPDEERRSHNDARRFARLLVSEIKLYNEKKVAEGREAHDLYERLREAIDRSREMYDKRVQPPVASKFDYFHYELVNALAGGDAGSLGSGYPGATV